MDGAIFPPRATPATNRYKCVVKGCESKANKNSELVFHYFPKPSRGVVYKQNIFNKVEAVDHRKAWMIALNISKVSRSMKVCSLHFKKEDYILPMYDAYCKRRTLKKTAVPSCNLPNSNISEKKVLINKARSQRINNRERQRQLIRNKATKKSESEGSAMEEQLSLSDSNKQLEKDNSTITMMDNENCAVVSDSCEININEAPDSSSGSASSDKIMENKVTVDVGVQVDTSELLPELICKDIAVQVKTSDITPKFFSFIKNNSDLSTLTGIETFDIFYTIIDIFKLSYGDIYEGYNVHMNTVDRILMTYAKLKQNLSYKLLSIMFNSCSSKHCQRIFHETVQMLSKCLKVAIPWSTQEEISKNLPACFTNFEHVRVVLDCTEIFIQNPKNLCCQVLTYSNYKGSTTCKIMTGVTPGGNISFLSKLYGGRASDSAIFCQSDIVQLLQPGDGIMVDKGFLIDEICKKNEWKCIRPPFLKDKKQLSEAESILTSKIAKARVHIERSNQRIKTFQIVGNTMPVNLVPLLEDIFIVICATINMGSPIISDGKFMSNEKSKCN